MADYTLGIGGPNVMMIRDLGGWVEFWFKTGDQTWNNDQWWSWAANGTGSRQKFRLLRGGNWQHFGSVYVAYDQTIRFTIEGAGLGWGTTDFFQHIQRSTTPSTPTLVSVTPISDSAFHVVFYGNYDGGSPILEYQIGYGFSLGGPVATVTSDGTTDVGGFYSGQRVFFWSRARNALGWSGWSNNGEGVTWMVPSAPAKAGILDKSQTSVEIIFAYVSRSNDPPILERQIGYSKDPTGSTGFLTVTPSGGQYLFEDLDPGGTYYFWGRARNSVGWGPWSASARVDLIAGARVLVGTEWKRAVPYVRDGGVWKVAEPWVKTAGVWKRTSV